MVCENFKLFGSNLEVLNFYFLDHLKNYQFQKKSQLKYYLRPSACL